MIEFHILSVSSRNHCHLHSHKWWQCIKFIQIGLLTKNVFVSVSLFERCGLTQTWDDKDEDIVTGENDRREKQEGLPISTDIC